MFNSYEVLSNFAYVRTGGSAEELRAAEYLKSLIESLGVEAKIEPFKVQASVIKNCSLKITVPYVKELECKAYTGSASVSSLRKELFFIRDVNSAYELSQCKDKIVVLQGYLRHWVYKDLVEAGACGIVVADGYYITEDKDIDQRELREPLKEFGLLPIVQINTKDLIEMIHEGATELEMKLEQEECEGESRNVTARIEGDVKETVIFTGHYDSTSLSKGAWDNGTGAVTVLKLCEYFASHKPHYSVEFVMCGSEERGLLGSKAFVADHEAELDKYVLNINIDMVGSVLAKLICCVTAEEKFAGYLDYSAKIYGKGLEVYRDVYSSDSTPFADKGIPAISFGSYSSVTPIHCRFDDMYIVDEKVLDEDIEFIVDMSAKLVNAKLMPVKRVIPDDMKEKLDYYLTRKRKL